MNPALILLVTIACATLFFRAADYERMNPWAWSLGSIGLTGIVSLSGGGIATILVLQVVLFVVLWVYNMRRQSRKAK